MVTPVTSLGSRSGVNWIRELVPCTVSARARASEVFPVPGKSSSSRCPSASRQVTASPIGRGLPRTAWPTLATSLPNVSANQDACSGVMLILPSQQLVSVADVGAGKALRSPRDRIRSRTAAPGAGDGERPTRVPVPPFGVDSAGPVSVGREAHRGGAGERRLAGELRLIGEIAHVDADVLAGRIAAILAGALAPADGVAPLADLHHRVRAVVGPAGRR